MRFVSSIWLWGLWRQSLHRPFFCDVPNFGDSQHEAEPTDLFSWQKKMPRFLDGPVGWTAWKGRWGHCFVPERPIFWVSIAYKCWFYYCFSGNNIITSITYGRCSMVFDDSFAEFSPWPSSQTASRMWEAARDLRDLHVFRPEENIEASPALAAVMWVKQ